jgi:hypothetical protein
LTPVLFDGVRHESSVSPVLKNPTLQILNAILLVAITKNIHTTLAVEVTGKTGMRLTNKQRPNNACSFLQASAGGLNK